MLESRRGARPGWPGHTMTRSSRVLVVAMQEEARPLLRHYDLRADETARGFRVYRSRSVSDPPTLMVVSGVGQDRAAQAVAYVCGRLERPEHAIFLNVGVCGCGLRSPESATYPPVGTPFLAHEVVDRRAGRSVYPSVVFDPPCATATVTTCEEVERDYREPHLFEMEAAGFFEGARRFATVELVHVLKIVSDSPAEPVGQLTLERIEEIVARSLHPVDQVLARLEPLSSSLAAEPRAARDQAEAWARGLRLSLTQRRSLERLAARALALGCADLDFSAAAGGEKEFLRALETHVARASRALPGSKA